MFRRLSSRVLPTVSAAAVPRLGVAHHPLPMLSAMQFSCRYDTDVFYPLSSGNVRRGIFLQWKKEIGERVAKREVLCKIKDEDYNTKKIVRAPVTGVLHETYFSRGDHVEVGVLLCTMKEGTAAASSKTSRRKTNKK